MQRYLLPFVLLPFSALGQSDLGCFGVHESGQDWYMSAMARGSDGGIAMVGWGGWEPMIVAKASALGGLEWSIRSDYALLDQAIGFSITATTDGGYAIGGRDRSGQDQSDDLLVTKVNGDGEWQWTRTVGTADTEICWGLTSTDDGGFLAVGYRFSTLSPTCMFAVRLEADGDLVWSKRINLPATARAGAAVQTIDGGFLVVGSLLPVEGGVIVKLNESGEVVWCKVTDQTGAFSSIVRSASGGYLVGGAIDGALGAGGDHDMSVMKLSEEGVVEWEAIVGADDDERGAAVCETTDGGVALVGGAEQGSHSAMIARFDNAHQLIWTRQLLGTFYMDAQAVVPEQHGGIVMGSHAAVSLDDLAMAMTLTTLDSLGASCPTCGTGSGGVLASGITLSTLSAVSYDHGTAGTTDLNFMDINSVTSGCVITEVGELSVNDEHARLSTDASNGIIQVELPEIWLANGPVMLSLCDLAGRTIMAVSVRSSRSILSAGALANGAFLYQVSNSEHMLDRGKILLY